MDRQSIVKNVQPKALQRDLKKDLKQNLKTNRANDTQTPVKQSPGKPQIVFFLHIENESALTAATMPFIRHGGLFIPVSGAYRLNDQIFLLVRFFHTPEQYAACATVVWITPANVQDNKAPGIGVRFNDSEAKLTRKVDGYMADRKHSKHSFTM